jgi:hypothetical protein
MGFYAAEIFLEVLLLNGWSPHEIPHGLSNVYRLKKRLVEALYNIRIIEEGGYENGGRVEWLLNSNGN